MTTSVLEVKKLKKIFTSKNFMNRRHFTAVDDVTFSMAPGDVLAIVGESGSGKSTLARMITNLIQPTSGDIVLNGSSLMQDKRLRDELPKHIQMIFQDPFAALNPSHRIGHIIGRPLKIHKQVKGNVRDHVIELLTQVGLTPAEDFIDKYPAQLSGGQKQRLIIAKILGLNPKVVVMDEPTSMLDVSIGIEIMNLLLDLKKEKNLSYIFITHNLGNARYMGDKILVMLGGQVLESGPIDEVIGNAKHPYTQLLLNSSPDPSIPLLDKDEATDAPDINISFEGCRFLNRCPHAKEECKNVIQVEHLDNDHDVRCVLYR